MGKQFIHFTITHKPIITRYVYQQWVRPDERKLCINFVMQRNDFIGQ